MLDILYNALYNVINKKREGIKMEQQHLVGRINSLLEAVEPLKFSLEISTDPEEIEYLRHEIKNQHIEINALKEKLEEGINMKNIKILQDKILQWTEMQNWTLDLYMAKNISKEEYKGRWHNLQEDIEKFKKEIHQLAN